MVHLDVALVMGEDFDHRARTSRHERLLSPRIITASSPRGLEELEGRRQVSAELRR